MDKPQQRKITVDISPEVAEGIYSNLAMISHNPSEFILDFCRLLPGPQSASQFGAKTKVFARIVMTPQNAKALNRTLGMNIERFESSHGEIKLPGDGAGGEIGFQTSE